MVLDPTFTELVSDYHQGTSTLINDPDIDEDGNVTLYVEPLEEVSIATHQAYLRELLQDQQSWKEDTPCFKKPDGYMYAPRADKQAERAVEVCTDCHYQVDCLNYAMAARESFGVWGGTTEKERIVLLRVITKEFPDFHKNWSNEVKETIKAYSKEIVKVFKKQHGKNIFEAQA